MRLFWWHVPPVSCTEHISSLSFARLNFGSHNCSSICHSSDGNKNMAGEYWGFCLDGNEGLFCSKKDILLVANIVSVAIRTTNLHSLWVGAFGNNGHLPGHLFQAQNLPFIGSVHLPYLLPHLWFPRIVVLGIGSTKFPLWLDCHLQKFASGDRRNPQVPHLLFAVPEPVWNIPIFLSQQVLLHTFLPQLWEFRLCHPPTSLRLKSSW